MARYKMGYKKFIRNTSGQNNKDKTVINSPQFEKERMPYYKFTIDDH